MFLKLCSNIYGCQFSVWYILSGHSMQVLIILELEGRVCQNDVNDCVSYSYFQGSWKVEAFSLCMFLLLPTLREVPHGTKGTGPKFVTRPVYSRSQLRNNTNTVSVLVLLMHLFHTLYTWYAGIAHHRALQTSGRGWADSQGSTRNGM